MEVPSPLCAELQGVITAEFYDESGIKPTNIIYCDKQNSAKVTVDFSGSDLARLFCLDWCVALSFETCGPAKEFQLPAQRRQIKICETPTSVFDFVFPPYTFDCDVEGCGTVYHMCVTVTAFDPCGKPAPFAGFCKVGPFMAYKPGTHITP